MEFSRTYGTLTTRPPTTMLIFANGSFLVETSIFADSQSRRAYCYVWSDFTPKHQHSEWGNLQWQEPFGRSDILDSRLSRCEGPPSVMTCCLALRTHHSWDVEGGVIDCFFSLHNNTNSRMVDANSSLGMYHL